ncbi:MAG: imidazole glycerol phosphate synthase subunit HisH [bacterium]
MIVILDFGLGNLKSIQNGFLYMGHKTIVTRDKKIIQDADSLILPGVGAFKDGMDRLKRFDLVPLIRDALSQKKPILGICLGLQLLFSESEEFGQHIGLELLKGTVKSFAGSLKIPHMGWNTLRITRRITLLDGIKDGDFFYFVHSFYANPEEQGIVAGETEYGINFPSVIQKDNLMATQFHPEKSSKHGLKILDNFVKISDAAKARSI